MGIPQERTDVLNSLLAILLVVLTLSAVACAPVAKNPTDGTDAQTDGAADDVTVAPTEEVTKAATEFETEGETYPMDTYKNPLSTGAAPDPVVLCHDGYYYATFTEALGIAIYRSRSLKTILTDEKIIIMNLSEQVQGNVWAPELHYNPSTDRWYVYASGSTSGWDFFSIRMFCLESVTNDPFGEYVFKGFTDPDVLAIDQTVFYNDADGTLYTAFSRFTEKGQVITLAVMENPWTVSDRRLDISYPKYSWEKLGKTEGKDERVNEGPVFLRNGDRLFLIYSASGCWSEHYCLGLLEFTGEDLTSDSVMKKSNWKKHTDPIFKAANGVYGVGHCFFFETPDGNTWISYHGMSTPNAGEAGRYMYVQPVSFDENGLPLLGEPLSRDTEICIPRAKVE